MPILKWWKKERNKDRLYLSIVLGVWMVGSLWWPQLNVWELKFGRWTFFGQWVPHWIEHRCLEYQYTKLGTQTYFGRWTYFSRWTPHVIEQRCLEYQYTKIGRWTYFGQWIPQWIKNRCLEYQYTKLGRQTYLVDGLPSELRIDALNTATPNLADKPTLADGPPKWIENRCLEYQYTKLGRWTYFGRWTPQCNASWIIYYGMYLAAIVDSSRKGGNFLLFLNN